MPFVERRWKPRRPLTTDQLLGIANYLTYGRIAIVPVVVFLLLWIQHLGSGPLALGLNKIFSWTAMAFFTIAQSSDAIDGYYARKYGVISSFGKFIDPLADKLLSMSALIMLIPLQRVQAWMVVLLMVRETTITALRGVAASEGLEISASDWGKKKTLIQAIAIGFLIVHYPFWKIDPHQIGMTLLWLTLIISVGSGMHYAWTFFREVRERQKDEHEN
jgi:CDP-diacylglycerol--glycerol-3-phosphate 3-phosphatidyltransferase